MIPFLEPPPRIRTCYRLRSRRRRIRQTRLLFTEQLKSFCLLSLYFTAVAQSSTHIPTHWMRPLASASRLYQDSGKEAAWPPDVFRKSWLF